MIAPSRKKKVRDLLRPVYFKASDDVVNVSDGEIDDLHLLIISRRFKGLGLLDRNDLIWDILMERLLQDEWGQITMTVARTQDERDPLENLR